MRSNFLFYHHLLVDIAGSCLFRCFIHRAGSSLFSMFPLVLVQISILLCYPHEEFRDLLAEHADVISSKGFSASQASSPPLCSNSSWTTSYFLQFSLIRCREARVSKKIVCCYGSCWSYFIGPSNSTSVSPLYIVQKPDGSCRPCCDYPHLNTQNVPDRYPLPNIADFTSCLHGYYSFWFVQMDAFWFEEHQVHVSENDGQGSWRHSSLFCLQ